MIKIVIEEEISNYDLEYILDQVIYEWGYPKNQVQLYEFDKLIEFKEINGLLGLQTKVIGR